MMRRLGMALAAAAVLAHGPAAPSLPEIPPDRHYYGPLRGCARGVAFDVREGEAFSDNGGLHFPGGGLLVEGWIYSGMDMSDIVRPLGTVELREGVRLDRIRLSSRNAPGSEIVYLHDTRARSPFPILSIRSNLFDGTDRDLGLLGRLAFGEAASALCASMPEPLRQTPERENPDAGWLDPQVHPGPLTICSKDMAFDVASGDSALLPWSPRWPSFRVLAGGRQVDVDLLYRAYLPDLPGNGPLAESPGILRVESPQTPLSGPVPDDGSGPLYIRLVAPDARGQRPPEQMPGLVFAFDRAVSAEGRSETVRRLRWRLPGDTCFRSLD